MPKKNHARNPRLFIDVIETGAIASTASVSVDYTPERDMEIRELIAEFWDANQQPFARRNVSSGNTAAGNAIPSLTAIEFSMTEDQNQVPFQKPFRLSAIASGGGEQRILDYPLRLYEGAKYRMTFTNRGAVAVAGGQILLNYNRADEV